MCNNGSIFRINSSGFCESCQRRLDFRLQRLSPPASEGVRQHLPSMEAPATLALLWRWWNAMNQAPQKTNAATKFRPLWPQQYSESLNTEHISKNTHIACHPKSRIHIYWMVWICLNQVNHIETKWAWIPSTNAIMQRGMALALARGVWRKKFEAINQRCITYHHLFYYVADQLILHEFNP